MPNMIITRGLPGSGKGKYCSEFLKKNKYVNVNLNDIRAMISAGIQNYKYTPKNEELVENIELKIVSQAIESKKNIIISDNNLSSTDVKSWIAIAKEYSYTHKVLDFFDEFKKDKEYVHEYFAVQDYVKECKETTRFSISSCPESVIDEFALEYYFKPISIPFVIDTSKPNCIIVDIDGTLAHMNGRFPHDLSKVKYDVPDLNVIRIIEAERAQNNVKVILMSGRDEKCRADTEEWLARFEIKYDELIMRTNKDQRSDDIVKYELYMQHVQSRFNAVRVYDDRNKVVEMWRKLLNLKVLQVQEGNF